MDFNVYNRDYFVSGNISGYNDYDTCIGVVRDLFDITLDAIQETPKSYLDVGCAYGFTIGRAQEKGIEAYGVEPQTYAYEMALKKPWAMQMICDSLPKLEKINRQYDLVTVYEVLEHIPMEDLHESVKRLWEVTAKTLVLMPLVVEVPSNAEFGHAHDVTHISVFNKKWWYELFYELDMWQFRDIKSELRFDSNQKVKDMFWNGRFFVFKKR